MCVEGRECVWRGEGVHVEGGGSVCGGGGSACGGGREINKRVSCDNVFHNTVHFKWFADERGTHPSMHLGY